MDEPTRAGDLNPWHSRESFPDAKQTRLIPMAALFALACLSFPLCAIRFAPLVIAPFLVAGLLWLTWKARLGAWLTLAASALLFPVFVGGASLGFLVLSASVGAFSGAFLFTVAGRFWLPLPIAAAAFGVGFAVSRDPLTASLALAPLPAVYLLGAATLADERRTVAVIGATAGLFLPLAGVAVWYVVHRAGAFNAAAIAQIAAAWKERAVSFLNAQYDAAVAVLRASAAGNNASAAMVERMASADTIKTYVDSVFNLIPAGLIILCEIPAFLAQKLLTAAYRTNGMDRVTGIGSEYFSVGVPTAAIWSLTLLLSFFGSPTTNRFFAVTENLRYLLLPALLVVGGRAAFLLLMRAPAGTRVIWWIAGLALLCCSPSAALTAVGVFGVYATFALAIRRAIERRLDDISRDGDDGDEGD